MYALSIVFLVLAFLVLSGLLGSFIIWKYYLSIKVNGPAEKGIKTHYGELENQLYPSGPVYVPWIPIKWDGHYPWDMIKIPTKQFPFRYNGVKDKKLEHQVWSKDHQLLYVDVSGYFRFPYDEIESVKMMIKAGVPFEEKAFQEWAEEEIISGFKDIMAGYTLEEAISRSNLTAISEAAKKFFLREDGLFARSGICGNDLTSFTPGTGEVILRLEQANSTEEIQKALQAPVVARFNAIAAKETAKQESTETIGALNLMIDEQIAGLSKEEQDKLTKEEKKEIRKECMNILLRGRAAKVGGLKDIRVANADGTPFAPGSIGEIVAAIALAWAAKEQQQPRNQNQNGQGGNRGNNSPINFRNLSRAEKDAAIEAAVKKAAPEAAGRK